MSTATAARPQRHTGAPRDSAARSLARIAVFAALTAVLGIVPGIMVPGLAVPITLQTLGVMLAGAVLGPWKGFASQALFLGLVALGLPLLSGGRGGLGVFVGASAGFLYAWAIGALVTGLVVGAVLRSVRRTGKTGTLVLGTFLGCLLGGVVVLYAFGIPGMMIVNQISFQAAATGSLAFIPGDLTKAVVATALVAGLWKAYPRALQ
ncbi:MAG: ECF transporter S component [Micrococcus sp.]|nr:ECF transporter S component [Micrococcus sp.]